MSRKIILDLKQIHLMGKKMYIPGMIQKLFDGTKLSKLSEKLRRWNCVRDKLELPIEVLI